MDEHIPADSDTYRFIEAVSDVMEASHSEFSKLFLSSRDPSFQKLVRAQTFIKKSVDFSGPPSLNISCCCCCCCCC